MQKDTMLSLRINSNLKNDVEKILDQLGIPMTTAINMYFNQIVLNNGIPFSLLIPEKPKSYFDYTEDELADSCEHYLQENIDGKYKTSKDIKDKYLK